jgi:hypothetical protein
MSAMPVPDRGRIKIATATREHHDSTGKKQRCELLHTAFAASDGITKKPQQGPAMKRGT